MAFRYASNPLRHTVSAGNFSFSRASWAGSGNRSATATIVPSTPRFFTASRKFAPAPLPRPPTPMITALIGCFSDAPTTDGKLTAAAAVAAAREDVLRNSRRETDGDGLVE